ncbi:hypothetical protein [Ruegeria sp. TM1040]|uniref:hypothetical protein n=1 Tax=Ruegeria sp. (strain TM1040) TaxID=292414 RepID=UPI0002D7E068|nr:hypothetical protein [Ruegeria sp. TM1040]
MKKRLLFGIIVAGFAMGLGAASQIWPTHSRAERIAELFYGICLAPVLTGDSPDTLLSGLFQKPDKSWIDTQSGSFLRLEDSRCTISTYAPYALSYEDAAELLELTRIIVSRDFPQLVFDPKAKMGDEALSKGWFLGAPQSPERWGIFHVAYPDWGG